MEASKSKNNLHMFSDFDIPRLMKTFRRKPASIAKKRWTAYAVAGAATAFVGSNCAEADIHYSGLLNVRFPPSRDRSKTFQLGDPDRALLLFHDYRNQYGTGEAKLVLYTFGCQLSVRGHSIGSSDGYVSKLSFGQNISSGLFGIYCGADNGFLAVGDQIGYWTDAGIGYIGFRINKGGSFQYGWMRVRMTGRPENGFALLDYAYADVGEPIRAGQTSSAEQAPDQGSLGWLALGAAGLLAWRKSRSRATS